MEPFVGKIADAERETKTKQVAERKDVIGETRRIGVLFFNPQIGLSMRCTPRRRKWSDCVPMLSFVSQGVLWF